MSELFSTIYYWFRKLSPTEAAARDKLETDLHLLEAYKQLEYWNGHVTGLEARLKRLSAPEEPKP